MTLQFSGGSRRASFSQVKIGNRLLHGQNPLPKTPRLIFPNKGLDALEVTGLSASVRQGAVHLDSECANMARIWNEGSKLQRRTIYGPMPVQTRIFREIWEPLVHMNFKRNPMHTESSSKVCPEIGIGSWMAPPRPRGI